MQYLYNFAMSHPGIFMIMFVFMCAAFSTYIGSSRLTGGFFYVFLQCRR